MKTNSLLNTLRSWQPRAPSPGLEQRLFRHPSAVAAGRPAGEARWHAAARSLMPAVAACLLGLILLGPRLPHDGEVRGFARGRSSAIAALSNQFYAAYLPAPLHSHQNASPAPRIGWTNSRASSTSTASFFRLGTNDPGQ